MAGKVEPMPVSSKVAVGGAAGAATTGPAVIILWLLGLLGVEPPPPEVLIALTSLATAGIGMAAGYMKRELAIPNHALDSDRGGATETKS